MQRIPAVPDFQRMAQTCDRSVRQDLEALHAENNQQQLDRNRPADREPILFRQDREEASPAQPLRSRAGFSTLHRMQENFPRGRRLRPNGAAPRLDSIDDFRAQLLCHPLRRP
jgi:hypothetical protein